MFEGMVMDIQMNFDEMSLSYNITALSLLLQHK